MNSMQAENRRKQHGQRLKAYAKHRKKKQRKRKEKRFDYRRSVRETGEPAEE